jgi:hypothetical protein
LRVFLDLENKILIEIKLKRLKNLWDNKLKKQAAIKYCKEHDLQYKTFDIRRNRLTIGEFVNMYIRGIIILVGNCKSKIDKLIDERKK